MLLSDCASMGLLPRFAQTPFMKSVCAAIDELVIGIAHRCDALPCNTSRESLAMCRDDELATLAGELEAIPYYADLPRATRENIIFRSKTWTRFAGTPASIETMLDAIFDTESARINDKLPEPYHYHVEIGDNFVDSNGLAYQRFHDCLETLGHVTTTPAGFTFLFDGNVDAPTSISSADVMIWIESSDLCV